MKGLDNWLSAGQQRIIGAIILMLLTGWVARSWRLAHPPIPAAPPAAPAQSP